MPEITVLYHYMYPDDVISARHLDGFCEGLRARGWQVEAMPCNRGCRDETKQYPLSTDWNGIQIRRIWRPSFPQNSFLGRILNACWMIMAWNKIVLRSGKSLPNVVVVGTDPMFSVLVAILIKLLHPQVRIAHWCFDLYPEALIANGTLGEKNLFVRFVRSLLRFAYRSCDIVVDIGSCMRERLDRYHHHAQKATLVPWALSEPFQVLPPDLQIRKSLFGDTSLGLLYSGNFGRAHSFAEFLSLARILRSSDIKFCFGVRGNCSDSLHTAVTPDDTNIQFAGFASESELELRLSAADIHLVSLKSNWTGVVVPSKFFGALAVGRPVLFAGSMNSCVARWIYQYQVGWVLNEDSVNEVACILNDIAKSKTQLEVLQLHCYEVYKKFFAKNTIMDEWNKILRASLE